MGFKILFGLFLIATVAGGLSYITHTIASGAAAKVEARNLAHAAKVHRESTEDVAERSEAAVASLEDELADSRERAGAHRARAAALQARVDALEADAEVGTCRPVVCRPGSARSHRLRRRSDRRRYRSEMPRSHPGTACVCPGLASSTVLYTRTRPDDRSATGALQRRAGTA